MSDLTPFVFIYTAKALLADVDMKTKDLQVIPEREAYSGFSLPEGAQKNRREARTAKQLRGYCLSADHRSSNKYLFIHATVFVRHRVSVAVATSGDCGSTTEVTLPKFESAKGKLIVL